MNKYLQTALIVVVIVIVAISLYNTYQVWKDCTEIGGTTVRGLFGYVCIK